LETLIEQRLSDVFKLQYHNCPIIISRIEKNCFGKNEIFGLTKTHTHTHTQNLQDSEESKISSKNNEIFCFCKQTTLISKLVDINSTNVDFGDSNHPPPLHRHHHQPLDPIQP